MARDDKSQRQFLPLNIAVLMVSDTCTLADDKSGQLLIDRLRAPGFEMTIRSDIASMLALAKNVLADRRRRA